VTNSTSIKVEEIQEHLNKEHPIKEEYHPYLKNINSVWKIVCATEMDNVYSLHVRERELKLIK